MAGVDHICNNLRVVAGSSRRKMKSSTPPFFPEEIIFNILLWLPAEVLYNVRYVCREWYNVINAPGFINSHLQKLTDDSLIIRSCKSANAWSVAIHNCNTQIRRLRSEFCGGFPRRVLCSCDGLLFLCCDDHKNFYVGNPIAKQLLTLPPISIKCHCLSSPQFTYARSTGRYKAHLHVTENVQSYFVSCLIFTVGTDSAWRLIDTKRMPDFFEYVK
ncbi:F-box protein CPR1-like [Cornus florida]|uniref:F-box protein CPR1-like n=1 Tax=Cornus florida TaxID=4283 RepID=UPI0028A0C790|nr:F-box protein CPR1-like [Cornus florida]